MGFLDSIRDRLRPEDDYDYYDEDDDFEGYDEEEQPQRSGLLGNTSRPDVDSVKVTTRGGQRVTSDRGYGTASGLRRQDAGQDYGWEDEPDSYPGASTSTGYSPSSGSIVTPIQTQLPPYTLRPVAYDDVMTVVRRVRTNQPVVIVFANTGMDVAKRILDFCFGLSYGLNGKVEELDDRVFVVLPRGRVLSQSDLDKLATDGVISR